MSVVQARGLTKAYGGTRALDGFDLDIDPGQIVGLIGPNGSGKTTALKSIMGLASLEEGQLDVFGLDPYRQRAELMERTAYIADVGILPRWMKIKDLIRFVADVNPGFDEAAARRTLADTSIQLNGKVHALSKGMNVQLHLALLMACSADLLVLDEPTLGLDLIYRQRFYDSVLNDYFAESRSILVTTHEVREIEHILTHVVFIDQGRVVLQSSMDAIDSRFLKVVASATAATELQALQPLAQRQTLHGVEAVFDGADRNALAAIGEVTRPNLAELFVAVVGGSK